MQDVFTKESRMGRKRPQARTAIPKRSDTHARNVALSTLRYPMRVIERTPKCAPERALLFLVLHLRRMELEEVSPWRQVTNTMPFFVKLNSVTKFFHAVEVIIPTEEIFELKV